MTQFPTLDGFGPTRSTLQCYSQAISALARTYAPSHPHWWHISLRVNPNGLAGANVPLPDGGIMAGRMDFHRQAIILECSDGRSWVQSMTEGLSGQEMGEWVIAAAMEAGLVGEIDRGRFSGDKPGIFDPDAARRLLNVLVRCHRVFTRHRARLGIDAGPIQLWPHGFDLSTEWFGGRIERYNEGGRVVELPAQINLGFYPGDNDADSYFYSNPWPFDHEKLLDRSLADGAVWHTEGWQGAMLPYTVVQDEDQVLRFATSIFEIASPLLKE